MKYALVRRAWTMSSVIPCSSNRKYRVGSRNGEFRIGLSMTTCGTRGSRHTIENDVWELWSRGLYFKWARLLTPIQPACGSLSSQFRRASTLGPALALTGGNTDPLGLQPFESCGNS